MSISLRGLLKTADDLLQPQLFKDYCPNGLQVEGRDTVTKLVTGVTACIGLIERAVELDADAILVHHGYFWTGEDPRVCGMKRKRLRLLLENNISLIAYHLPLDASPRYGNNAKLADLLEFEIEGGLDDTDHPIGNFGRLAVPMSAEQLSDHITDKLDREPLHVGPDSAALINTIAWCTGGAQGYIDKAVALGVDAFLTGEASEQTTHTAREMGIHFFAAGHHATERGGVQALGQYLASQCDLEHLFIDIDNPV